MNLQVGFTGFTGLVDVEFLVFKGACKMIGFDFGYDDPRMATRLLTKTLEPQTLFWGRKKMTW